MRYWRSWVLFKSHCPSLSSVSLLNDFKELGSDGEGTVKGQCRDSEGTVKRDSEIDRSTDLGGAGPAACGCTHMHALGRRQMGGERTATRTAAARSARDQH
jgi:hypothetical protein